MVLSVIVQAFPGILIGASWKARPVAGLALSLSQKKKKKKREKGKKNSENLSAKMGSLNPSGGNTHRSWFRSAGPSI